jgi:acyl carrier protein
MKAASRVEELLPEIIRHFAPKRAQALPFNRETHLVNDAGIDSARMIDVVLEIEDRFKLTLEDDDVQELRTFGDLIDLVRSHANGNAASGE